MDKIQTKNETIKENEYLVALIQKYNNTSMKMMKINLKTILNIKAREYGGLTSLAEYCKMNFNTFKGQIYTANPSKITLDNLLWICGTLDIPTDKIFETNNNVDIVGNRKFWTDSNKLEFIKYYEDNGVESAMEQYALTRKSAQHYYQSFRNQ